MYLIFFSHWKLCRTVGISDKMLAVLSQPHKGAVQEEEMPPLVQITILHFGNTEIFSDYGSNV